MFLHVTDTQFIDIPAGALGVVGSNAIPTRFIDSQPRRKDLRDQRTGPRPAAPLNY